MWGSRLVASIIALALCFGAAHSADAQINLAFPSATSTSGGPTGTGPLGPGDGYLHYIAGDDLTQLFVDTGFASTDASRWVFSMSDITDFGIVNNFAAQINGITVGNFSFTGTGVRQVHDFDLTFTHGSTIVGDDYQLRIVATSSVPINDGAWNWIAGGGVTLTDNSLANYWDANGATDGSGNAGGVWNDAHWTTSAAGNTSTSTFAAGQKAIFSAGADGVGPFIVVVDQGYNVKGITFEEGGVTLGGAGTLNLTAPMIDVQTAGATATINAQLSGSVGLVKTGPGSLVLTGSAFYTGDTVIGRGTLQLGDGGTTGVINVASTMTLGDALTQASDVALLINRTDSFNVGNPIVVSAGGTGKVTIGTIGDAALGSPVTFTNTLTLNRPTTLLGMDADRTTYTNTITGNVGTLTVTGGARTTWQGSNTFVGDVVITGAGTILQVGGSVATAGNNRIPDNSRVHVGAGTWLRLQNNNEVINALSGSGTVENIVGSNTLTVGAGNGSDEFSGVLQNGVGTLALTKTGNGTQTLSGANTYTGATLISAGALNIQHASALGGSAGATTVASGARLELAGGINVSTETLSLAGTGGGLGALYSASGTNTWSGPITLSPGASFGAASGATLIVAQSISSGTVNIGGQAGGLVKFTGTNTYTGGTVIAAGGVSIASPSELGNPSGTALINFTGHGTLQATGTLTTTKELTALVPNSSITIDVASGQTLTANGAIRATGGANSVGKTGEGTLVLNFNNSQLDSDLSLLQGTLDVRHAGGIGNDAANDFIVAAAGTTTRLTFDPATAVSGSFQTAGSGAAIVVDRVSPGAGATQSMNNLILGGAHTLNISAGGSVTSGVAGLSFSGNTTLQGDATLQVNDGSSAGMLLNLGAVAGAGHSLTIAGTGDTNISGAISIGSGTLIKDGAGTLTLSSVSTYTGQTNINAGVLALAGGSIASSSLTTVGDGATLQGSGATGALTIAAGGSHRPGSAIGTSAVQGDYNLSGNLFIDFANSGGSPGVDHDLVDVNGAVSLNSATSVLNTTYSGTAGTFNPTFAQVFTILRNDGLDAASGTFASLAAGSSVLVDGKELVIYYDQGTGNDVVLVSSGGAAPQLFVNDQWTTASTVDGDSETIATDTAFVGVNAFATTASAFAAQTNYSGPLRLNAGTYASIDLTATGSGAPGDVVLQLARDLGAPTTELDITIQNLQGDAGDRIITQFHGSVGGNLIVEQGVFAGSISGSGGLTKQSSGTFVISGTNTYTGPTIVSGGVLRPLSTDSVPTNVTVNSGGTFDVNGLEFDAASRDFTIAGSGASGTAGAITNTSAAAGSILNLSLTENAQIGTNQGNLQVAGIINGGGQTLTIGGSGVTSVLAENALTNLAGINVASGTLRLEHNQAPTAPLAITVNSGALLESTASSNHMFGPNLSAILSGGTLQVSSIAGKTTWHGALQVSGDSSLVALAPLEISGAVSGSGDLTKLGPAPLVLSGTNSFSGTTHVAAGTLIVGGNSTAQGDYQIDIGARLGGTGSIVLANGQSLRFEAASLASSLAGELSPGAAAVPFVTPLAPIGYAGRAFDATYSAGLDPATIGLLTITGDIELGGDLLIDFASPTNLDVVELTGDLLIGPSATLEINGDSDFTQLDFFALGLGVGERSDLLFADQITGSFSNVIANQSFIDAGGHAIVFGNDGASLFLFAPVPQTVPESSTVAAWLLLASALALAMRSRRAKRN